MDWKLPFFGKRKNFNVSKDRLNCSSRIHMVHRDVGTFVLEFLSRLQVMCKHLAVAIISTFGWANCCFGWCDIENFRGFLNLGYTPMLSNLHQNTCTSRAPTDPLGGGLLKGYSKIHWFGHVPGIPPCSDTYTSQVFANQQFAKGRLKVTTLPKLTSLPQALLGTCQRL